MAPWVSPVTRASMIFIASLRHDLRGVREFFVLDLHDDDRLVRVAILVHRHGACRPLKVLRLREGLADLVMRDVARTTDGVEEQTRGIVTLGAEACWLVLVLGLERCKELPGVRPRLVVYVNGTGVIGNPPTSLAIWSASGVGPP